MISFADLLREAKARECDRGVWTTTPEQLELARRAVGDKARPLAEQPGDAQPRRDKEPKYYLLQTALKHVPMTPAQAARINASIAAKTWQQFLSPRQLAILQVVKERGKTEWPVLVDAPLMDAWSRWHAVGQ